MRSWLILFSVLFFLISSCKKDNCPAEKEILPITNWTANQEVRITKVELKDLNYSFLWATDSTSYIEYKYDSSGMLNSVYSGNYQYNDYFKIYNAIKRSGNNKISFYKALPTCNGVSLYGFDIINCDVEMADNRVQSVSNIYYTCGFGNPVQGFPRTSKFSYAKNGLLSSINSNTKFLYEEYRIGTDIDEIVYDTSNAIKSLNINSYSYDIYNKFIQTEKLVLSYTYQPANDIPDGLRRLVNQSILGLNSLGYEDYYFHRMFVSQSSFMPIFGYSDWFGSFGISQFQTIPAQNIGLIQSKHIKGKIVLENDQVTRLPVYTELDSVINYNYIHDATNKTLEISSLKIYYELLE